MFYSNLIPDIPTQRLRDAQKTKGWAKANVKAISMFRGSGEGRLSREEMSLNRDVVQNKLDMRDFLYVVDPGNTGIHPHDAAARLRQFNIVLPRINHLQATQSQRFFKPFVVAQAGGAFERLKGAISAAIHAYAQYKLMEALVAQGAPLQLPETPPDDPQTASRKILRNYKDVSELNGNLLLTELIESYRTDYIFQQSWRNCHTCGEEIVLVDEVRGVPSMGLVNSEQFDCHLAPDQQFVDESSWARYRDQITLPDVIDEYGDELKPGDIKFLEQATTPDADNPTDYLRWSAVNPALNDGKMHSAMQHINQLNPTRSLDMRTGDAEYHDQLPDDEDPHGWYLYHTRYSGPTVHDGYRGGLVLRTRVQWKSLRRLCKLRWLSQEGRVEEAIVDEDYQLAPEEELNGVVLVTEWITEVWQGTMLGAGEEALFLRMRRLPWQNGKLSFVGHVYRAIGEEPIPLVSLLRPIQFQQIGLNYRIEEEINKARGKKIVVYLDDLPTFDPNNPESTMDSFLNRLQNDDVAFLTRAKDNVYGQGGNTGSGIPIETVDLTASAAITQMLNVSMHLSRIAAIVSGMGDETLGVLTQAQPLGSMEGALAQSSHMQEPMFIQHDLFRVRALECLLLCGQACNVQDTWAQLMLDDQYRQWVNIDVGAMQDTLLGVTMRNSPRDMANLNQVHQAALASHTSGQLGIRDLIATLRTKSLAEAGVVLEEIESRLQQMQQAGAEQAQAAEKALADDKNALEREKIAATITVAQIQAGVKLATHQPAESGLSEEQAAQLQLKQGADERKAAENQQRIELAQQAQADKASQAQQKQLLSTAQLIEQNKARQLAEHNAAQSAHEFEREQNQQDRQHQDNLARKDEALSLQKKQLENQAKAAKQPTKS